METFVLYLLITLFVVLLSNKKDWVAPSVIFTMSFVLSGIVFSLNSIIWNYQLTYLTKIVILSGIYSFFIGSLCGNIFFYEKIQKSRININVRYYVPKNKNFILMFISLLLPVIRIADVFTVVGSFNLIGGLEAYRGYEGTTIFGTLIKIIGPISNAFCIIMMFVIVNNRLLGIKNKKTYYIPIISYFIACAMSSSRIDVIYMFLYFVFAYVFLYRIKTGKGLKLKQYIYVVVFILSLSVTFFGLGYLSGKSQKQESAVDNVSMYAASSFAAFDYYLDDFRYDSRNMGTETLVGISNFFSWIGVDHKIVKERSGEFLNLGDMRHSTNVYTCFRPLLHDYNYCGMYIILFVEGFIFQLFYKKTISSYKKGNMFWCVFYIYFCAYLMLSSVAERVFYCLLTLTTMMFLISIKPLNQMFVIKHYK